MEIPSINLFSNQPGGGILAGMNALNDYVNRRALTKTNQVKAQYAPVTTQAEAMSKLAYANLMGPQFVAKMLQDPGIIANMGDPAAKSALQTILNSLHGQQGANSLNQMPAMNQNTPQDNSLMGKLLNKVGGIFGHPDFGMPKQPSNALVMPQQGAAPMQNPMSQPSAQSQQSSQPQNLDDLYMRWMQSDKGKKSIAENPYYYPTPQQMVQDLGATQPMNLELTTGNRAQPQVTPQSGSPDWFTTTGQALGRQKQAEKLGEYRAEATKDIGQEQKGFAQSGAVLDKLINVTQNPVFINMRNRIPAFQDKQLGALKLLGSPEEKELLGEYDGAAKAYIGSVIGSFKGTAFDKKYDLANKMKIQDEDSMYAIEGKLKVAKTLKEMDEKRNDIMLNLLANNVDEGQAVKIANKMLDTKAIESQVKDLFRTKATQADIDYMVNKYKGKKTREQIINELKQKGYL
jgi:hypothetical protein